MPKAAPTSKPREVVNGVKRFSASLSDQAIIDAGVGLIIIVVLSMLLLRTYQRPQIQQLPAGSVASADIIAPEDVKIEDTAETNRARDDSAAAVLPVFDFNPKGAREAVNSIQDLFAAGRAGGDNASIEDLHNSIEERCGIALDNEQIAVLLKRKFSPELEQLMTEHFESVALAPIVSSRSQFRRLGVTAVTRRDIRGGQEAVVSDLGSVADKITASTSLRSEKLVWPADYDARERRLLGEILGSLIAPNFEYNDTETQTRRESQRDRVPPAIVSAKKGEPIVLRNEIVSPAKSQLLAEAGRLRPIGQRALEFAGTVIIVMMLTLVLWQYLLRYQRQHLRVRRHFLLQIASFIITLGLARLFFAIAAAMSSWATTPPFNSPVAYKYLAPLAVGAVLITILTDAHAAFVSAAILTVFVGIYSGNMYLAAFTLMSSAGAIYHLKDCRDRTALVGAGLSIGYVNAATCLALDLLGANEAKIWVVLFDMVCGFAGGLLATMVASILLPLFEWLFEITTSIKLLELSNLNLPLLKQLAERAPGTYHHSIMVGLLAEGGAEAIGGDALFARVACYYHDIGKSVRPSYFVENQIYIENRHDQLSPKMSSIVLMNHVKQGIELAKKHKLPPRIIAIIPQHHGTGLMKYFYYKARKQHGDVDSSALEHEFRYPGPKPQTKEAAIIMIADSVEAAARTVNEPNPSRLRSMIEMITGRIRDDGQFDECDITQRELKLVADSFVKVLMGIHHHRIAYPGYDFNRTGTPAVPAPLASVNGVDGFAASDTPSDINAVPASGSDGAVVAASLEAVPSAHPKEASGANGD